SHRCIGVAQATDALRAARAEPIDVAVLTDDAAPATALWLARRLRDLKRDLAVVMLTGGGNLRAAVDAMRIGVFDCLCQPFHDDDLGDVVDRALDWQRAGVWNGEAVAETEHDLAARLRTLRAAIGDAVIESTPAVEQLLTELYADDSVAIA